MSGQEHEKLQDRILAACGKNLSNLQLFTRLYLGKPLDMITGYTNVNHAVFELVCSSERNGTIQKLLDALTQFEQSIGKRTGIYPLTKEQLEVLDGVNLDTLKEYIAMRIGRESTRSAVG